MTAKLRLTGFLEAFNGEPCLLLQVQWKHLRLPFSPTLMASALLRIPYQSPWLPPSRLTLKRSFLAAEFSPGVCRYLDEKIASFLLELVAPFTRASPPSSFFIVAEIKTHLHDDILGCHMAYLTQPLMPRRLDPVHQPQGVPLISRLFVDDACVGDFPPICETEEKDSQDQNRAGLSLKTLTKLRELGIGKEGGD